MLSPSPTRNARETFGAISFTWSPIQVRRWKLDIYDDKLADYVNKGEADYDFGVTCLAQDDKSAAAKALRKASGKTKKRLARARLVDIYFSQQAYDKVMQLYSNRPDCDDGDQTIVSLSDSFDKTGNTKKAADIIESAIVLKPDSGPLYLALASYYQRWAMRKRPKNSSAREKASSEHAAVALAAGLRGDGRLGVSERSSAHSSSSTVRLTGSNTKIHRYSRQNNICFCIHPEYPFWSIH